jgi:hypothetical protein
MLPIECVRHHSREKCAEKRSSYDQSDRQEEDTWAELAAAHRTDRDESKASEQADDEKRARVLAVPRELPRSDERTHNERKEQEGEDHDDRGIR